MRHFLVMGMTIFTLASNAYASAECDVIEASARTINLVAKHAGAKSFDLETHEGQYFKDSDDDGLVAFTFVTSKGQRYVGVSHVNMQNCETGTYTIQKSTSVLVK